MDMDVAGKKILLRVDINSSIDRETNTIRSDPRIKAVVPTLESLKEAAIVIVAHQGRHGKPDCTTLKLHADRIQEYLPERKVLFAPDQFGDETLGMIQALQPGEVLVLENVRMWAGEEKKGTTIEQAGETELVQRLSPLFDYFVNDAFGAAHRGHVSLVGWPTILAGPQVAQEFTMVNRLMEPEHPSVWLVGGAKAWDKFTAIKFNLEEGVIDTVLVCGLTATLILEAQGVDMGEANRKLIQEDLDAHRDEIVAVYNKYKEKILLPVDMAIDDDGRREYPVVEIANTGKGSGDIGAGTIAKYSEILRGAKTIVANGPPGIFEQEVFKQSSFALVDVMAETARAGAYVVIGGGEMGSVAELSGQGDAITISSGGGALLEILSGKEVPLARVLREKMPE
jgi:phosphoglycerate kinase